MGDESSSPTSAAPPSAAQQQTTQDLLADIFGSSDTSSTPAPTSPTAPSSNVNDIMSLFGHNPGAVGGRESIGSTDDNKPWNRSTKVLAPEPTRSGASSSTARRSGSSALKSSPKDSPPARNDRRGGYEKDNRRIRNEDPVYGRR